MSGNGWMSMKCPNCGGEFRSCRMKLIDVLMLPLLCRPVRCVECSERFYRAAWFRPVWIKKDRPSKEFLVATPYRDLKDQNSEPPTPRGV
jgi:hypothetical protein